jgi:hypothetical protein
MSLLTTVCNGKPLGSFGSQCARRGRRVRRECVASSRRGYTSLLMWMTDCPAIELPLLSLAGCMLVWNWRVIAAIPLIWFEPLPALDRNYIGSAKPAIPARDVRTVLTSRIILGQDQLLPKRFLLRRSNFSQPQRPPPLTPN